DRARRVPTRSRSPHRGARDRRDGRHRAPRWAPFLEPGGPTQSATTTRAARRSDRFARPRHQGAPRFAQRGSCFPRENFFKRTPLEELLRVISATTGWRATTKRRRLRTKQRQNSSTSKSGSIERMYSVAFIASAPEAERNGR